MLCYPHERPSDAERTTLATGSDDFHGGGVRQDHRVPEEEGTPDVYALEEGHARVRGEAPMMPEKTEADRLFYHTTFAANVPSILRAGLRPALYRSNLDMSRGPKLPPEERCIYLWDNLDAALDFPFAGFGRIRHVWAVLEVRIPGDWAVLPDHGYV